MKCDKCIFAKEIDVSTIECRNPYSDWEITRLFESYDGCLEGKASTVGIDALQRIALMRMGE